MSGILGLFALVIIGSIVLLTVFLILSAAKKSRK